MLFEGFLQNFIKNFEDQERIDHDLKQKKLTRFFSNWKKQSIGEVRRIVNEIPQQATSKTQPKQKPDLSPTPTVQKQARSTTNPNDEMYNLHPDLERDYMLLVVEFRKVASIHTSLKSIPKYSGRGRNRPPPKVSAEIR